MNYDVFCLHSILKNISIYLSTCNVFLSFSPFATLNLKPINIARLFGFKWNLLSSGFRIVHVWNDLSKYFNLFTLSIDYKVYGDKLNDAIEIYSDDVWAEKLIIQTTVAHFKLKPFYCALFWMSILNILPTAYSINGWLVFEIEKWSWSKTNV